MTTVRDEARAALARADAWPRPNVPTEASELLDYVSTALERLLGEPVTDAQVDAVQEIVYDDYREGDRAVIRRALEAARDA